MLSLTASGGLDLLDSPFTLDAQIDLRTGRAESIIPVERSVSVAEGLSLDSPELTIGFDRDGFDWTLSGPANIAGVTTIVDVMSTPEGWVATGQIDDPAPIAGVDLPTISFALSSNESTINVGDFGISVDEAVSVIDLEPFRLTGFTAIALPDIGLPGAELPNVGLATVGLGAPVPDIEIAVPTPDDWYVLGDGPGASTSLRLSEIGLAVTPVDGGAAFSLNTVAELTFDGDVVLLEGSFAIDGGSNAGFGGSLTLQSEDGWRNAFGVDGLTVQNLAIQVDVRARGGASFGVAATAQLPAALADPLGMDPATVTTVAGNIGTSNSCFFLELDAPDGANAINLGDVVTAQHARLGIAPTGCEIGSGDGAFSLAPGFSLLFDGEILGTPVQVDAEIATVPEFSIDASLIVGAIDLGGVELGETSVGIIVEPSYWEVSFGSSIDFDGTTVAVEGFASAGADGATLEFTGAVDQIDIGVAAIEDVEIMLAVSTGLETDAFFSISGGLSTLGTTQQIELELSMRDGVIQHASGLLAVELDIEGTGLSGELMFDYVTPNAPTIEGEIQLTVDGFALGDAYARVGESGLEVEGSIQSELLGEIVLAGSVVFDDGGDAEPIQVRDVDGEFVDGSAGDFSLFASVNSLDIGGFKGSGEVSFGSIDGLIYLQFEGHSNLGGKFDVNFAGDIQSNGDFSFEGDGALRYGKWGLDIELAVAQEQGDFAASFSTTLDTTVATVDVAGEVERRGGKTNYRLTGRAALNLGLGTSEAEFIWTNKMLVANVRLEAGSTVDVEGSMSIYTTGSFSFKAKANVSVAGQTASLNVGVTNCVEGNCERHTTNIKVAISGKLKISGVNFSLKVKADTSGKFDAKLSIKGKLKGGISLVVAKAKGSVKWEISVRVTDTGFKELKVKGNGSVHYTYWTFWDGWKSWRKLGSFGFSGSVNNRGKVSGSIRFSLVGNSVRLKV